MTCLWRILLGVLFFWGFSVHAKTQNVLSSAEVKTYRQIFAAIKKNDFHKAENLEEKLQDDLLKGYVLYQKYMNSHYKTTKAELKNWLNDYQDLPVANEIYVLAKQKKVKLDIPKPAGLFGKSSCSYMKKVEPIDLIRHRTFPTLDSRKRVKARRQMQSIVRHLNAGHTKSARTLIDSKTSKELFPQLEHDAARTALAFSYFLDGNDDLAIQYANQALKKSSRSLPLAYWTAGLAYWRKGNIAKALDNFTAVTDHPETFPLLQASSAFWAARCHLKLGNYKDVGDYLEMAIQHPRTFYGLLALRTLGSDLERVWDIPAKPEDDIEEDFSHPALKRFYALKQIGNQDLAKKELAQLYLQADKDGKGMLLMISEENDFDKDLLLLAGELIGEDTRYPLPNWTPMGGWFLDKALVYAFVRHESCFNQYAKSSVGAVGLMQLMPKTAKEIARNLKYSFNERKLHDAEYNLSIGQNYLAQLLAHPEIQNNLIFTAVGYNAGPGNLGKWKKTMHYQNDPLLFIESVPSKETRAFIERIMVNYWIYCSLTGKSLQSLDQVVSGKWPLYKK